MFVASHYQKAGASDSSIPGVLAGGESALQIIIIIVYTTYSSYYLTASQSSRVPNKPPAYTQVSRTASGPLYPSGSSCVTVYSLNSQLIAPMIQLLHTLGQLLLTVSLMLVCLEISLKPSEIPSLQVGLGLQIC